MEKNWIHISSEMGEELIAKLRENPPQSTCSCCRYESLEQFMIANFFIMADLREYLREVFSFDEHINNGESYDSVVRDTSVDMMTRENGGYPGCINGNEFGFEFREAVSCLKAGDYGSPVVASWDIHIIKRGTITDDDIIGILKNEYIMI